jgi:hypothetical protein
MTITENASVACPWRKATLVFPVVVVVVFPVVVLVVVVWGGGWVVVFLSVARWAVVS